MNNFIKQVSGFWNELRTGQKISLMASLTAVLVGISLLLYWASRPQYQLLYGGLPSKEMADVVASLEEHGIKYKISDGGRSIMVPHKNVYTARMQLAEKGLPSGGGVGYEIFDKSNFGVSDFMQKTNYMRALQGELSRTISEMNGIRSARVMIVVPENKLLSIQARVKPTASVFVDTAGNILQESAINSIRALVSNSVEGLNIDDVAVVDNHGKVLSEDMNKSGEFGIAANHIKIRENLENYFGKKVESMLYSVLGEGHVVARVSVDLETSTTTVVEEKYDPESQVVRSQTFQENRLSNNETNSSKNVAEAEAAAQGALNETASVESRKNRTVAYDINKSTREVVAIPGTIKRMTAAVFIAMKYDKETSQAIPRSEKDIQSLTEMVANALGIENKANVSVQEVEFNSASRFLSAQPELSFSEKMVGWASFLKNFFALTVSMILLFVFSKMIKNTKSSESTEIQLLESNVNVGQKTVDKLQNYSFNQPSPAILNELIKQKPENVSVALRDWMKSKDSSTNIAV